MTAEMTDPYEKDAYEAFLRAKMCLDPNSGFEVADADIHPLLLPHQREVVRWAVRGGRRALFEAFGLGKSLQQIEALRLTLRCAGGGRGLIVCPLGVRREFARDAAMVGVDITFVRRTEEVTGDGLYVTNYESVRDGRLDPSLFAAVSLDEASVLRSYGSKTYQSFLSLFAGVPYRFVATATPSPNRLKELIHYAGFLGVMDTGAALTRFFQRDSTQANNLTLMAHKEQEFWLWVSSWAVFLQRPSDLGHSDFGYDLPPVEVVLHELPASQVFGQTETNGQTTLMADAALSLSTAAREKRDSLPARVAKMAEIVTAQPPDTHWLIWHTLEDERHAVCRALPDAVAVYGSQDEEEQERAVADFADGRTRILAGKPVMLGSGVNFQRHCHSAIFLGVDYRANDLMQAVHRIQRFQQPHPCVVHLIHTEAERQVVTTLLRKWDQHKRMVSNMTEIIRKHGLSGGAMEDLLSRSLGVDRVEVSGRRFTVANNDAVLEARRQAENSVGLVVTSIPFSNHYEYTPCYDEQTEVLTRRGWLSFGEVKFDDMLATVNPQTLQTEWQSPSHIVWQPYSGPMYHFRGRNSFDLLVTPNHRMFFDTRVGNRKTGRRHRRYEFVYAADAHRDFAARKWSMVSAPEAAPGIIPGSVEIPPVQQRFMPNSRVIERIAPDEFMRLAGWYLSEGHCSPLTPEKRGRISIAQSDVNPAFRAEIIELFERIGLPVNARHITNINAWSIALANFLVDNFGAGSHNKRIPRWVKDLDPSLLTVLRDTMMKGDGNKNGYAYTSYSRQLRDDFQEICLLTGWRASVRGNVVRIGQRNIRPEVRSRPAVQLYDGMIGCVTVPNRTLIVRRDGHAVVCGNSYNDFGHTDTNDHFWRQMDFLTPEMLRMLQPGRLACVHVKDRILFGNVTGAGAPTVSPFHCESIQHYIRYGFDYLGMVTVVTDVVRENNQTYRLGWTENSKDGTKMGVGSPEYVILLRKPQSDRSRGYADAPVVKDKATYTRARWQVDAHALWRSSGDRPLTAEEMAAYGPAKLASAFTRFSLENVYDYEYHVSVGEEMDARGVLPSSFMALAPGSHHPDVWHDAQRMRTLNGSQAAKGREAHICPLQFDIVNRLIARYSNPDDLVYDPFAGLMTVPVCAIKAGRRGGGSELNAGYFRDGLSYLQAAEAEVSAPTLFDFEAAEADEAEPAFVPPEPVPAARVRDSSPAEWSVGFEPVSPSPSPVPDYDPDADPRFDRFCERTGYSREEAVGMIAAGEVRP